ncbi:MAG: class I SAM-dependent methyltransferase [Bacteroidia bacterium]|nr:class I SAM-dependent methyltransferase [Bacteroidia bacterium]MDW8134649.1 class I SAM-dependent methyltransferase [Bacteroidia bacterium]
MRNPSHLNWKEIHIQLSRLPNLHPITLHYFMHQFRLGNEVLVPFLSKKGILREGMAMLEIGCAEGGVLAAFHKANLSVAIGTDIETQRLQEARHIAKALSLPLEYFQHDILHDPLPPEWIGKFDIIVLRDVIEHLEDPERALRRIYTLLKDAGYVFFTFPPYYSPYGGHQHTLLNFWGRLPYIHLLPERFLEKVAASGWQPGRQEVMRLRRIRLSVPQIKEVSKRTGFSIISEKHYFLRPVFRYRLRAPLPAIPITPLVKAFPHLMQFFCTEAGFVLQKIGSGAA